MAPANTGSESKRRMAVIRTDQTNRGTRSIIMPSIRIFIVVVMKLSDAKIEEAPARCREKIAKSTDGPAWVMFPESGGYTVHPVPAPFSTMAENTRRISEGGSNQNLMLFNRGNAMSGAASIRGTNQFPNPPIITGITRKKIIKKACAVTIVLYNWSLPKNLPGCPSSVRISSLIDVPSIPDQIPKIRYRVPMSLWLVEHSQRI